MTDIATTASPARSIVFIDSRVQDAATLLQGLDPGTEVVFLQAGQDGLAQMAAALGEQGDVAAVQVIAHGSAGQLWLGSRFLDNTTLQQPEVQALLASLGRGLTADGDLLLYACNTAEGSEGAQFVSTLAALTGADVAASDDRTGAGGDWELEITSGALQTGNFLNGAALTQYAQDLILRTVTSNADNGAGTLRQTIIDAGAGDTITFNAGMSITLTTGQLSIAKNLTIDGDLDNNGTADVTVNGNAVSRVLSITSGTVVLDGLTITNGKLAGANGSGGSALGAGISVTGGTTQVNILHSGISGNAATGGTGSNAPNFGFGTGGTGGNGAGGLYVGSGATVQMAASTLTGNTGTGGSGGYGYYAGGTGGNGAGGLYVGSGGTVQMAASTLTGNTGTGGAGGDGYDAGGTGGNGTGGVLVAGGGTFRYQSGTVTIIDQA